MSEKDFGEWNVPTSWAEVTLGQVQALDALNESTPSLTKVVSVLSRKPLEEVEQLPLQFTNSIISKMDFIRERPEIEPSVSCVIGGERYSVNVAEDMKLLEFVAVEDILKNDKNDVAGVLAVICRKAGEVYDSEFENKTFAERKKMFLNASCMAVLPVIGFFLLRWELSENSSRRYSVMKEEAQNLIAKNISLLRRNGGGAGYFTRRSWERKLKRLGKYIDSRF